MTPDQFLALFGDLGIGFFGLFCIVLPIFTFVCMCIIMHKCGRTGWCLLIPIYNLYVLFKIWWKTKKFGQAVLMIASLVIAMAVFALLTFGGLITDSVAYIISLVISVATWVIVIILFVMSIKLNCGHFAKAFGKDSGFGVGLFFLPVVFIAIIALDKDIQYVGPHD